MLPAKMPRSAATARERDKKITWLRGLREKVQYFSLALRPQTVRAMWVGDIVKKEA